MLPGLRVKIAQASAAYVVTDVLDGLPAGGADGAYEDCDREDQEGVEGHCASTFAIASKTPSRFPRV